MLCFLEEDTAEKTSQSKKEVKLVPEMVEKLRQSYEHPWLKIKRDFEFDYERLEFKRIMSMNNEQLKNEIEKKQEP